MKAKCVHFLKRAKFAWFNIYVATNMLLCATLLVPWALPRETLSGFIGRRALLGSEVFLSIAKWVDSFYPNSPAHCGETAMAEDHMRSELYPDVGVDLSKLGEEPDQNFKVTGLVGGEDTR